MRRGHCPLYECIIWLLIKTKSSESMNFRNNLWNLSCVEENHIAHSVVRGMPLMFSMRIFDRNANNCVVQIWKSSPMVPAIWTIIVESSLANEPLLYYSVPAKRIHMHGTHKQDKIKQCQINWDYRACLCVHPGLSFGTCVLLRYTVSKVILCDIIMTGLISIQYSQHTADIP